MIEAHPASLQAVVPADWQSGEERGEKDEI